KAEFGLSARGAGTRETRQARSHGLNQAASGISKPPITTPNSSVTRGNLSARSKDLCRLVSSSILILAQYSGVFQWKKCWPQLISSPAIYRLDSAARTVTVRTRGRARTKGSKKSLTA